MRVVPAFERARSYLRRSLLEPESPLVVVEVRQTALGVVRLDRQGGRVTLASAASTELLPGTIDLSLTEPGVKDAAAVGQALRGLLERAGALREATAALVLPDPVGRISVLPAQELPGQTRRRARGHGPLSAAPLRALRGAGRPDRREPSPARGPRRRRGRGGLSAGARGFRGASGQPGPQRRARGAELPGASVPGRAPRRRHSARQLGRGLCLLLLLVRDGFPLLARTLPQAAATPDALPREVSNTLLYYQERLGGPGLARAFLRSAVLAGDEAAALLSEPLGMLPSELDPWAAFGGGERQAGQALASALAVAGRGGHRRAA